jgi:hypothetical protein
VLFACPAVILCTGGAGRVYRQNTNAGIVTGGQLRLEDATGGDLVEDDFDPAPRRHRHRRAHAGGAVAAGDGASASRPSR